MINGDIRSKVDRIWDTMWSGGISNPLSVIEQLTYLLFIKRLDELHTLKESKANRLKTPIEDPVFDPDQDHLRWSRFKQTAPETMFATVKDEVFPFIKSLGAKNGDGDPEDSTYSHHMRDAIFMFPKASLLANIVDQLDAIPMAERDTKGDLYEYMLGKIATAGQNGQFRTPRHIIKLMVEMVAPTPKDVICDPACGTAGFLIAASEYLVDHHSDAIYKTRESRRRFNEGTFHGYDFDSTMLRIGSMNMLLHGVEKLRADFNPIDTIARFGSMLAELIWLTDLLVEMGGGSEPGGESQTRLTARRQVSQPGERFFTEGEIRRHLNISPGYLARLARKHDIEFRSIGGRLRFNIRQVHERFGDPGNYAEGRPPPEWLPYLPDWRETPS